MDMVQLGQSSTTEFEDLRVRQDFFSSFNEWPSREDPKFYCIAQLYFELSNNKIMIEREAYSALEWLGDVGGLFDGLSLIIHIILGPIIAFMTKSELLRLFSRV